MQGRHTGCADVHFKDSSCQNVEQIRHVVFFINLGQEENDRHLFIASVLSVEAVSGDNCADKTSRTDRGKNILMLFIYCCSVCQ